MDSIFYALENIAAKLSFSIKIRGLSKNLFSAQDFFQKQPGYVFY